MLYKKVRAPMFAFRCEWTSKEGYPDGFTYSVTKPNLISEMARRRRVCGDKPKKEEVVMISADLFDLIMEQPSKVLSTVEEKHELDLSKI